MGITYFFMFIAFVMAGIVIFLLKDFLESALGYKDDPIALVELQEMYRKNEIESRRAEVYIHNYMVGLEQARCEKERRRKPAPTLSKTFTG